MQEDELWEGFGVSVSLTSHSGTILGEQRVTAVLWAYLCLFWASDGGLGGRGDVVCPSQRQMRFADARE